MPDPDDDAALDRRVSAAARLAFDEHAVTDAVLRQIDRRPRTPARKRPLSGLMVPAAFASVLAATPLVVATYPATDPDAMLIGLASGDPLMLFSDLGTLPGLLSFGLPE